MREHLSSGLYTQLPDDTSLGGQITQFLYYSACHSTGAEMIFASEKCLFLETPAVLHS